MEGAYDAGMMLVLLFKFNFGDISFSVMECLIFSALITTTVSFFSTLSADPMLAMIMLVVYIISDVQLR